MSSMNRIFSVVLVLLLSFAALPSFINAQTTPIFGPFGDGLVELDGDVVSSTSVTSVERGDTVEVKVKFTPTADAEGVRLEADIRGLEDEDIEDRTDLFDVKSGITYTKTLELEIPEDLSEDDLDEEFSLQVDIDGDVITCTGTTNDTCTSSPESARFTTGLIVTSARHDLRIQDIVFRSGSTVDAGSNLFVTVWVENKGSRSEEDISVKVSVPQLGLSARDVIDELVTAAEEDESNRDRDTDTEAVNFALKVPSDAEAGDYDLVVEVDYNRGRESVRRTESFAVSGGVSGPAMGAETIVTVDTTSQSVKQGEGTIYKFSFANLGSSAKTFTVEVTGVETWGSARVDPAFVTVQPGSTSEAFVFVTAKDDASLGKHLLTARVKEGSKVLKDVNLEADVQAGDGTGLEPVTGAATWDQVRRGLEIGFAVLLIILVILGIIIAIGKLRKPGEGMEEEPGQSEGQSYYYYPRY